MFLIFSISRLELPSKAKESLGFRRGKIGGSHVDCTIVLDSCAEKLYMYGKTLNIKVLSPRYSKLAGNSY